MTRPCPFPANPTSAARALVEAQQAVLTRLTEAGMAIAEAAGSCA